MSSDCNPFCHMRKEEEKYYSNEMKLILALCEALDFDVAIEKDYQPTNLYKVSKLSEVGRIKAATGERDSDMNLLPLLEDGKQVSYLKEPILSFNVTSKKAT